MNTFNATILGGLFDPIHEGHLKVVKDLFTESCKNENGLVVIATCQNTPWDKSYCPTSFEHRLKMWELVLDFEEIPWSRTPLVGRVCISDCKFTHAEEFMKSWMKQHAGTCVWSVASDCAVSVKKWSEWSDMNIALRITPSGINLKSSDIRNGQYPLLLSIREYAIRHSFYPHADYGQQCALAGFTPEWLCRAVNAMH